LTKSTLGFLPLLIPLITTVISGAAAKKAQKKQASAQAAADARQAVLDSFATGAAVPASDLLTARDTAFLRGVWPSARQSAQWGLINWSKMPGGKPPVTAGAYAAMDYLWPKVRTAANFDAVNWMEQAVPRNLVAAAMPLPELPQSPVASPASGSPYYASAMPAIPGLSAAGLSWPMIAAAGAAAIGLILLTQRR
jgi:hypothetical protein